MNLKYLFTALLFLFSFSTNAQHVVISNTKMNVVYIGVPNPIHIAIADYSAEAINVNVSQGMITGENGDYIWNPVRPTKTAFIIVSVNENGNKKILDSLQYRVKRIPMPYTQVNGRSIHGGRKFYNNGNIITNGLVAELDNFPFEVTCSIISFKTIIIRDEESFFENRNQGGRFQSQTLLGLQMIEIGDMVLFSDVKCQCGSDNTLKEINDLIFKIR